MLISGENFFFVDKILTRVCHVIARKRENSVESARATSGWAWFRKGLEFKSIEFRRRKLVGLWRFCGILQKNKKV